MEQPSHFREEFDDTLPMLLPEVKNIDFQINFTHPMNYLCLVEERLLREIVLKTNLDSPIRKLFPLVKDEEKNKEKLAYNLSSLKICLAHFGGEGEWTRYMEQDREVFSQRLLRDPEDGINFLLFNLKYKCEKLEKCKEGGNCENFENCKKSKRCEKIENCTEIERCKKIEKCKKIKECGKTEKCEKIKVLSWNKLYKLWHKADWYSIISSMLIDYQNIYADISYIISKESIYPLLKYTLEKGDHFEKEMEAYEKEKDPIKKATLLSGKNKLRSRVLFGTDFYVVRNHHSDKDLFIKTKTLLSEEQFDLIARENTHTYLQRSYSEVDPMIPIGIQYW